MFASASNYLAIDPFSGQATGLVPWHRGCQATARPPKREHRYTAHHAAMKRAFRYLPKSPSPCYSQCFPRALPVLGCPTCAHEPCQARPAHVSRLVCRDQIPITPIQRSAQGRTGGACGLCCVNDSRRPCLRHACLGRRQPAYAAGLCSTVQYRIMVE